MSSVPASPPSPPVSSPISDTAEVEPTHTRQETQLHHAASAKEKLSAQDVRSSSSSESASVGSSTAARPSGPSARPPSTGSSVPYTRTLDSAEERNKNSEFVQSIQANILRPYVTRTWGGRKIPTHSEQWKKLKRQVLQRDGGVCRFCAFASSSFVCDHINGNAGDNSLENLGTNCSLCDMVRHCGFNGMKERIELRSSNLSQVDIVKRTRAFFHAEGRAPRVEELDPAATVVEAIVRKDGRALRRPAGITIVDLANALLRFNYDELSDASGTFKAFFTGRAESTIRKEQRLGASISVGAASAAPLQSAVPPRLAAPLDLTHANRSLQPSWRSAGRPMWKPAPREGVLAPPPPPAGEPL